MMQSGLFRSPPQTTGSVALARPPEDKLDEEEIRNLQSVFDVFDSGKTGYMSRRDIKAATRALGFTLDKIQLEELLVHYGKGREDNVDFSTFEQIVHHNLTRQPPQEQAMAAFHHLDIHGTGLLDDSTLAVVVRELDLPFTTDEIKTMISEFDADKDGRLTVGEFLAIFSSM